MPTPEPTTDHATDASAAAAPEEDAPLEVAAELAERVRDLEEANARLTREVQERRRQELAEVDGTA